jgi:predicted membrane GTPase involved in stress response
MFQGLDKVEVPGAAAGDIVSLAGLEGIAIGETLADPTQPIALPTIKVEEPTVRMTFGVNTSPFSGKEGKWGTSRKLRERLFDELRTNVALRVDETESAENFLVSGRGELHLGILIETMRREGYEFQVSRPEVIFHKAAGFPLPVPDVDARGRRDAHDLPRLRRAVRDDGGALVRIAGGLGGRPDHGLRTEVCRGTRRAVLRAGH